MMAPARSASFTIQSRSKKFKAALALLRLLNLILNAVEAMGSVQEGPRELSVCTEQGHANGVLVVVRDSGPGIDAEQPYFSLLCPASKIISELSDTVGLKAEANSVLIITIERTGPMSLAQKTGAFAAGGLDLYQLADLSVADMDGRFR
jgi:hypothetical protein